MKGQRRFRLLMASLGLVLVSAFFLSARLDVLPRYRPLQKEFYLTQQQVAFIRPGLSLEILEVTVPSDRQAVVNFSIQDPKGLPLDRDGVFTPGPVSTSFILARIPAGESQYESYTTRPQTSPITGDTALQAASDSGGTYTKVEDGVYTYKFATVLPAGFDQSVTHTVGIYARRDLTEFDLDRYVDNATFDFVPNGAEVTVVRDVVLTENCNQCHNPLAEHGGARTDVELCVLCHSPQSVDPDTGNTVDFKVMIHKIHRGEDLPSVQAGIPYQIVGFRQSVHDYSEVIFPQDIRNCVTCHKDATQTDAYLLRPTRDTCGSCHDDVDFASGEGHIGGPQVSDNFCSFCHFPEGELEFDASIKGAHTIPRQSQQLKGLNVQVMDVSNTMPGHSPTVFFKITENDGTELAPSDLNRLRFNLVGPAADYSTNIQETVEGPAPVAGGYTYTFEGVLPQDAQGTFAIGTEARRDVLLNEGTTTEIEFREQEENNPVFYFGVDGVDPVPRRTVVEEGKCNQCHEKLSLHGDNRHDPEYCVTCHIADASDVARRPEEESPPESIHFKYLIHRIHRGPELTRDFTVYGFGNRAHNYNELGFPGDLRDCESCHVEESYTLPLLTDGLLPTEAAREFFSPMEPETTACLSCHDTESTAAHAFTQTAPFGEACAACHGTGKEFSVERIHAR